MKNWTIALIAGASLVTAAAGVAFLGGGSPAAPSPAVGLQSPMTGTLVMCPHCCPPDVCGTNGPSLDGNAEPSCDESEE